MICKNVGKYEKNEIVRDTLERVNERKNRGVANSLTHDEKSFVHALKEFHLLKISEEQEQVPSEILLKIIVDQQNEALR